MNSTNLIESLRDSLLPTRLSVETLLKPNGLKEYPKREAANERCTKA